MQKILVLGAGRSTNALLKYLKQNAKKEQWEIKLGDFNIDLANEKADGHPAVNTIQFDILNSIQTKEEVEKADLVISMLPAHFHFTVAKVCVQLGKHLVTASYNSNDINTLSKSAEEKDIIILMECGLDPGIDHMTAMAAINEIKNKGGMLTSFKSFTGGLIAPESDNNPWHYKFTWNPRNVVLAGQGAAKFIRNNRYKYVPYHKLFTRLDTIHVEGLGEFEGYPNRDSLSYRKVYGLEEIPTLLRGTLRKVGFSAAWNVFVQLGITDDSYQMEGLDTMTNRDFINSFLKYDGLQTVEDKLCDYTGIQKNSQTFEKLKWLGIFDETALPVRKGSPAQVTQALMEKKLSLSPGDKDMIVMQHQFEYELAGEIHQLNSSIISIGEDENQTAMAKTVGLPLGIAVKNILNGTINLKGVHIPIRKEIYEPILAELVEHGVSINETHN